MQNLLVDRSQKKVMGSVSMAVLIVTGLVPKMV